MKKIFAVLKKEVRDNLRDKRTIFFALLYGPILLPLLMIAPMATTISKRAVDVDKLLTVHMVAPERAPNLVNFLLEENIKVKKVEPDFKQGLLDQDLKLVIELSDAYEENLRKGKSASVKLYFNRSDDRSNTRMRKVSAALRQYGNTLAALRLDIRGLDTDFIKPIHVVTEDVHQTDRGAKIISTIVPFVIVFSLTMGGFYLAVDSTAGERERQSLEPLLSLSLSRSSLVMGKLGGLITFVSVSGLLSIVSLYLVFRFVPVEALRRLVDAEFSDFATIFAVCSPLIVFFSAALMLIATYAKDTKEAQTHLGIAMMIPMAPFFILQAGNVHGMDWLFYIPVMSQFMLIDELIGGQGLAPMFIAQSVAGTLATAGILIVMILKLYRRDSILGH